MLKCYRVVKFANKLNSYNLVSKKFGDVKKISLFERSEFAIFRALMIRMVVRIYVKLIQRHPLYPKKLAKSKLL